MKHFGGIGVYMALMPKFAHIISTDIMFKWVCVALEECSHHLRKTQNHSKSGTRKMPRYKNLSKIYKCEDITTLISLCTIC